MSQIDRLLRKAAKSKKSPHWCVDHQKWETEKHDTVEPFKNWVEKQTSSYSQGGRVRTTREGSLDATVPHPSTTREESQAQEDAKRGESLPPLHPSRRKGIGYKYQQDDPSLLYSDVNERDRPNAELQSLMDIFPASLARQAKRRANPRRGTTFENDPTRDESGRRKVPWRAGTKPYSWYPEDPNPLTPTDEALKRGRSDIRTFATPYPFDPTSESTTQGGAVKTTREEKLRYGNKSLEKALLKLMKQGDGEGGDPDTQNPPIPRMAYMRQQEGGKWEPDWGPSDMTQEEAGANSQALVDTIRYSDQMTKPQYRALRNSIEKNTNGDKAVPPRSPVDDKPISDPSTGSGGDTGAFMTDRQKRVIEQHPGAEKHDAKRGYYSSYPNVQNSIEKALLKLMKQGEEDEFKIPKPIQPSDKSPQMDQDLKDVFGVDRRQSIKSGACTMCKGEADKFRDDLSRKEYGISGMCQDCQDNIFGGAE